MVRALAWPRLNDGPFTADWSGRDHTDKNNCHNAHETRAKWQQIIFQEDLLHRAT